METIKLSVEPRQEKGKGKAGRLRRSGKVPGIFYGPGKDAVSVCVNTREFQQQVSDLEGSHLIQFLSKTEQLNGYEQRIKGSEAERLVQAEAVRVLREKVELHNALISLFH